MKNTFWKDCYIIVLQCIPNRIFDKSPDNKQVRKSNHKSVPKMIFVWEKILVKWQMYEKLTLFLKH